MSKSYVYHAYGEDVNVIPYKTRYISNNNTAIRLVVADGEYAGEEWNRISVNIDRLPENLMAVDTNNCSGAERFLQEHGFGKPTGNVLRSGFCTYPIYRINLDMIENDPEE